MSFPTEIIERIIEISWSGIVTRLRVNEFLTLMLVNKTFKRVMYKKRDEMMRAQALVLYVAPGIHPTHFWPKRPLQNIYLDQKTFFLNCCRLSLEWPTSDRPHLLSFIRDHCEWLDSKLETEMWPMILKDTSSEEGSIYVSSRIFRDDDNDPIFFGNVIEKSPAGFMAKHEFAFFQHGDLALFRYSETTCEFTAVHVKDVESYDPWY